MLEEKRAVRCTMADKQMKYAQAYYFLMCQTVLDTIVIRKYTIRTLIIWNRPTTYSLNNL